MDGKVSLLTEHHAEGYMAPVASAPGSSDGMLGWLRKGMQRVHDLLR